MKRLLLSLFSAAALLFAGLAPAQVSVDSAKTGISRTPHLLCASAVPASVTGTTSETALATCTVPANAMGLNGGLEIRTSWSHTNSVNNKVPRVRFGGAAGTQLLGVNVTTTASTNTEIRVRNRGAGNSQASSFTAGSTASFGSSTGALAVATVDTTVAFDVVISGQLANAAETITLEGYEVWLLP